MAYESTVWKTGDVVTSSKLNKLENGVANSAGDGNLIVHETVTEDGDSTIYMLDKTWQELYDMMPTHSIMVLRDYEDGNSYARYSDRVSGMHYVSSQYSVESGSTQYTCNNPNEYPRYRENGAS